MPGHSSVTRGVLSTIPLPLLMQPRSLTGSHRELFPIRAVSSAVKSAFFAQRHWHVSHPRIYPALRNIVRAGSAKGSCWGEGNQSVKS
ncbi:hypothetical protein K456DRAFT_56509 [Colletotrichum gloeosporioides 23]|nr:hypothetical protein K456DRAFT_56509 [Colletotrichum gloeosporioides 23]